MSFVNYGSQEIYLKIVYYGPAMAGKTANLKAIYEKTRPDMRGNLISLATETERTLFFDFMPVSLGMIRGFKTRMHLYTVPGQPMYEANRKVILRGADGVVFVADSQKSCHQANVDLNADLYKQLKSEGRDAHNVPLVYQYNKRDHADSSSLEEMKKALNPQSYPDFSASVHTGEGVFETLKAISKLALSNLKTS